MALTEYRLQDLARISGVSTRNIRAYRERGLLDPPRKEGRSAFYDSYHLAQLLTINDLLARGFTSVHIAEFFETLRTGRNLTDVLGLQRAILRPPPPADTQSGPRVMIDPGSAEGTRLVELELAQRSGAGLVFTNEVIGGVVARAADPAGYVKILLGLLDDTGHSIDALAGAAIESLKGAVSERYGTVHPSSDNLDDMTRLVADFAEFTTDFLVDRLERALRHRLVAEISEFNSTLMVSGHWDPGRSAGE